MNQKIIFIGGSTGGIQALERLLPALPKDIAGILIVQHMPEGFTKSFSQRINTISNIEVKEVEDNEEIVSGKALIAQGGKHLIVEKKDGKYFAKLNNNPKVSGHKPSADVLFKSAAQKVGKNAVGVILTGMGNDGAKELKTLHDAGAKTIAQSKESCVVFGMPKSAIELGAIDEILDLDEIAQSLL